MIIGSESIGETRPGDKIRRGSIRLTMFKVDLELCGEQGTGLGLCCCVLAGMWLRDEIESTSGLAGGTAKEQHHDRRRDKEPVAKLVGLRWLESPIVILRERSEK